MKNSMSGNKEFSEQTKNENRHKSDRLSLTDIRKNLYSASGQKNGDREEIESREEITILQETNKLHTILCCLLGTTTNLLRIKIELILIKNEYIKKAVINAVDDVQLKVNEALRAFFTGSAITKNSKLQEIQNFVERSSLHVTKEIIDLEEIVKEAHGALLEFQAIYKHSKSVLEVFVQGIENKFENNNVSNNILDQQSTDSTRQFEDIVSQKFFLAASIKSFQEFECLMKHFMKISTEDSESRIDALLLAIHKAESACNQLNSFTWVLQNFECTRI